MGRKIWLGRDCLEIVGVYINNDMEGKLERLREWTEIREKGIRVMIGGDFNARTGREGGEVKEEEEGREGRKGSRNSKKDGKMNGNGRKLCEFLGEQGWWILNTWGHGGNTRGDEEGEWTYTGGRGESVIDYILENERKQRKRWRKWRWERT